MMDTLFIISILHNIYKISLKIDKIIKEIK